MSQDPFAFRRAEIPSPIIRLRRRPPRAGKWLWFLLLPAGAALFLVLSLVVYWATHQRVPERSPRELELDKRIDSHGPRIDELSKIFFNEKTPHEERLRAYDACSRELFRQQQDYRMALHTLQDRMSIRGVLPGDHARLAHYQQGIVSCQTQLDDLQHAKILFDALRH